MSVTTTPVAASGPLFPTVTVNFTESSGRGVSSSTVLVTYTSASWGLGFGTRVTFGVVGGVGSPGVLVVYFASLTTAVMLVTFATSCSVAVASFARLLMVQSPELAS